MRRTLMGAVLPLLATALLLALPPAAGAQVQRVLVITLSEAPLTAQEDSTTPGTTTYGVNLSTQPTGDVTVTVVSGDKKIATVDTDTITADDQDTLTFTTANWHTAQSVTVTAVDDNVDNVGDERSVTVTTTPSGGGFTRAETVEVTVYDEDEAALTFTAATFNADFSNLFETGRDQRRTYTVSLATEPTGNVVVDVASGDTGAATVNPSSLTFTPKNYETAQTVTVTGVDDRVANDPARSVTIVHTPSGGGYGPDETGKVEVTVTDGHGGNPVATPTRGLTYSPAQPIVVEGQQTTYTVKLNTKPTGTVRLELSRNTAQHLRFRPTHLVFTTVNWDTPQPVTVTGFDDNVDNGADDAAFAAIVDARKTTITHLPSGGGYDGLTGSPDPTELIIGLGDNDTAGVVLSRSALRLVDEGTTGRYTVKLNSQPTANVEVAVAVTGDTTAATVSPLTLTFAPAAWNKVQTVIVTADNDDFDDPGVNRMAPITHTPTSTGDDYGASDQVKTLQLTVVDSDTAGVTLSTSRLSIKEGETGTYTVVLNSDPETAVVFSVTSDNAAATTTAPVNFTTENWSQPQTITVTGVDDNVDNVGGRRIATISNAFGTYAPDETVQVTVTDGDPTSQVRLSSTSLRVSESGGTAIYTVSLRPPALSGGASVTVTVPSELTVVDTTGTAVSSLNFTETNWRTAQRLTVSVAADDDVDNGDRAVFIQHTHSISGTADTDIGANVRVTIVDDDNPEVIVERVENTSTITEAETVNYNVTLGSEPPSGDTVSVYVVSSDPGVAAVTTGSRLDFTSGTGGTAQPVTVTAVGDDVDSGARRSVNIMFTPGGGGYGTAQAKNQRVTVIDDDTAGLNASPDEMEISERGGSQSYSLSLATRPTGTVRVTVTSDSNVATVKPSTLTFRPEDWGTPQGTKQVEVTGVGDAARGDRTTTVTNTPAGGGYGAAQSARVTVKVLEDVSPGLVVAPATVTVDEGGTSTYTVELNSQPQGDVTVTLASGNTSVATVSPASMTFTTTNWDTPQPVTVTGNDDSAVTGDRSATITHQSAGGDFFYDFTAEVTVTVTEDDAVLTMSRQSVTVDEARTGTYTVSLEGRPTATVTVDLVSADSTVATVSPPALTFTTSNYSTPQTVTVTGVNDSVDNAGGARSTNITHTPKGGGYDTVEPVSVPVSVTDDEGFVFSKSSVTVAEAGGTDSYTVRLSSAPTASVTVALASSNSRAATVSPAALTFTTTNWSTAQRVTVTGVDDDVDNSGDARSTTITHRPSGAGYSTVESVGVTVTDDDAAPSGITLTVQPTAVAEDVPATITVTATPDGNRFGTTQTVSVTVGASSDSATEGTDYAAVADFTVTIPAGAEYGARVFTLSPIDDQDFEGDETITVSGTTASGVPVSKSTITIEDDDTITVRLSGSATVAEGSAANFTVSLVEGAVSANVVVTYTVGGTATPGVDYTRPSGSSTILAGSATSTIRIPTTADDVLDRGETLVVALTGAATPSGMAAEIEAPGQFTTTIDDSGEVAVIVDSPTGVEGEPVVFTVTLSGSASTIAEPVTLRYATADGADDTATAGADYTAVVDAAVVVEAGNTQAQFTVATLQDDQAEPDETFTVTLAADASQPLPEGVTLGTTSATGTIDDDDELTVDLTGPETVPEGEAASFTVTLSQPLSESVTVSYATADGTAAAGADYAAAGADAAATIAVGATTATFMVDTEGDTVAEENETFTVQLTALNRSPALATLKTVLGAVTVTIVDDDRLSVSVAGPRTVVEGSVATFTVTLAGGTGSAAVVVDYSTSDSTATRGRDYTAPSGKLTIAAGAQSGRIAIQIAEDKVIDPRETLVVKLTGAATTGTVTVGSPNKATTTIVDPAFESINRVNEALLPGVARASAASTFDALSRRMELAAPIAAPMAMADMAGLTDLYRALQANERALQDGSFDLARVLGGSSFLVPLNSHDGTAGSHNGMVDSEIGFAIWGSGDYRGISGGDADAADVDWSGSGWGARLGADMRFIDSLLAGLAVSWTGSALDYEDDTGGADRSGTYGSSLISVHPYVGWTTPDYGLWAAFGLGWGEVQIDDSVEDMQSTGMSQWSLGAGASVTVLTTDAMIEGGTTALKLKAEGLLAHAEVEKSDAIDALGVDVNQVRAVIEASHAQHFPEGGSLTPSLELGGRLDGGAGESGAGLEVGGGVSYADSGFAVEARGRGLVFHGGNYGEWGLSGLFQYDPGTAGHGLMVSVRPTWGATESGTAELWEHGSLDLLSGNDQAGGRIEAEIGYGLAVYGASGVLTPYAGASLTDAGANSLSVGGRLQVAPAFEVSLEALRSESGDLEAVPDYGLTLEGAIRW